ncbi:MAG: GGDEF domain-containing protein [Ruminococcus sp.]|nr:GGDEF domain-containing protein [Ruminococcus sp.]
MKAEKIKNIAVIVAGIDEEYQSAVISGINSFVKQNDINAVYFTAFGGVLANSRYDIGEYNIYNLVNYEKFDGVILMNNTICAVEEREKIIERVRASGKPVIVFDCDEYPEFYNISIDNTGAMKDIVKHIICHHKARTVNYISGPLANPEANARYKAFEAVMQENGMEIDGRRVYYGEFRPVDGQKAIEEFVHSGLSLPDAFICANDAMALSAVITLEKHGYKVPQDVMVTGFDHTYNARNYHPAISSVKRPLFDAGRLACETLMKLMSGEKCEHTIALEAEAVFYSSCGCNDCCDCSVEEYKKSSVDIISGCRTGISLLNRMTSLLAETESPDDNINVIGQFMDELECEACYLCLCSEWQGTFNSVTAQMSEDKYVDVGYTKTMSAPLIWKKGGRYSVESYTSSEMFPEQPEGSGNISYFLPLHFREHSLGYYIVVNGDFPIASMLCHSIMMSISNSIENIRKLLHLNNAIEELDKLYVIDPLCDIYNRNGFIRVADAIFRSCAVTKTNVMISFIDMDGLKLINDNFGHNEGDFALRKLAGIIKECCGAEYICARFGGDEFIVFGSGVKDEDVEALERKFETKLAEFNNIVNKPYELAASIGTCVTDVDADTRLFKLITQADEKMYEQKKRKKTSRYLRRS